MSNWIEWKGGECPVDTQVNVEAVMRSGNCYCSPAEELDWKWNNCSSDIVSYRISTPTHDEQTDDCQGSALIRQEVMS